MTAIPDIIGVIGVILTLLAYFLLQINKMRPDKLYYSLLNAIGSVMILFSLFFVWNLSAWLMEFCWLLISISGVWKYYRKHHHV